MLDQFGTLGRVVSLPEKELSEILGSKAAAFLQAIRSAWLAVLRQEIDERPHVTSSALARYFVAQLAYLPHEQLHAVYLDAKHRMIADRRVAKGSVVRIESHLREILKGALDCNATGIVVLHNHPSGDPTPSDEDIAMTARLASAARPLELRLLDHIIIGRSGWISFKARKLLV